MKAAVKMTVKHTAQLLYYTEWGIACITIFAGHSLNEEHSFQYVIVQHPTLRRSKRLTWSWQNIFCKFFYAWLFFYSIPQLVLQMLIC
jgi:hypothetical protein